jgi:hypothetical protein
LLIKLLGERTVASPGNETSVVQAAAVPIELFLLLAYPYNSSCPRAVAAEIRNDNRYMGAWDRYE